MSPSLRPSSSPSKATAFRFKSKRPRSRSRSPTPSDTTRSRRSSSRRYLHHHRHHHRSHRPASSPSPSPPRLDRDTAFRESLFDALADDEGAAFWEGVYGQPVHTYSPYRRPANAPGNGEGELERMTDEEYTAHVRAKMWEKSHGYLLEGRAEREGNRARRKEREHDEGRRRAERRLWESRVDEVLGRKSVLREADEWEAIWEFYTRGWEILSQRVCGEPAKPEAPAEDAGASMKLGAKKPKRWKESMIPWPTKSGNLRDVNKEMVEEFLRNRSRFQKDTGDEGVDGNSNLLKVLKAERVRWHPDKIQQRYGVLGIDEGSRKGVTAVFQILDRMWVELKEKNASRER
ncbi:hypothetical protein MMC13_006853 [Lambiella insularis]|nr:hypothetical protein [Lambiella insularis]